MQFISSIITSSHAHDLIVSYLFLWLESFTPWSTLCAVSQSQHTPLLSTIEELQVLGCIGNYMEQTSSIFTAFHPGSFSSSKRGVFQ